MSRPWKVAFLLVLGIGALYLAYHLRAIFLPLFVALLLGYLLNPLVNALERRGMPRLATIGGVYFVLTVALALLLFLGLPAAVRQGVQFVDETFIAENAKINRLKIAGKPVPEWLSGENVEKVRKNLSEKLLGEGKLAEAGGKIVGTAVAVATASIGGLVTVFSFIALVPVYLFFILKSSRELWAKTQQLIPAAYREKAVRTILKIDRAVAAFFRGQLTISLIEGAIVFLGLLFMGVKFSYLFGVLYAVLSIVPYLGVVIGFVVTELFVIAEAGGFTTTFFLVAGLFGAIQALEAAVLQPLILGKETGLHPVAIILALLICGELFGFLGLLLAVPIASTVKILFEDYVLPMLRDVASTSAPAPPPA